MKRSKGIALCAVALAIWGGYFFYVSPPNGDDYGMTAHYMSLPPCEIVVGSPVTMVEPPRGFDTCKFEGMVQTEEFPPDVLVEIRNVEGPPISLGTLKPGESKTIRLWGSE